MAITENKNKQEEPKKPRRRVKKARGHGGHHGGSWKVAYADFVTAMMALFLVLWLVSQADVELKQAIASYFRSPGVFDTQKGGIMAGAKKTSKEPEPGTPEADEQSLLNVGQNLQKKFETRPDFSRSKDQVKIEINEEGLRIQIIDKAERVSFTVGSAVLTEDAKALLAEIAAEVCTLPNPIKIGGHTDSRVFPSINGYTNWELSADRANAARREIQNGCVKPEQVQRIIGYADTDPIDPSDPFAPANRRISITVMRLQKTDPSKLADTKKETETKSVPVTTELKTSKKVDKKAEEETKTEGEKKVESGANQALKNKLIEEGKVSVGEPDKVPSAPKSKEPLKSP